MSIADIIVTCELLTSVYPMPKW